MRKDIIILGIISILAILGTSLGAVIVSGQIIPDPTWLGYGNHDVDIDLGIGEIEAYIISIERGDRVVVDLTVVEGGAVDFYSMNNYSLYMMVKDDLDVSGGTFDLYFMEEGEYSRTSSLWISYEYTAIYDDTLIILVDNSNMVENGAVPTGDVVVSGSIDVKQSVWTMENIVITLVIVVAIIIIFVGLRLPAKKKRDEEQRVLRQAAMVRRKEQSQQLQHTPPRQIRRTKVVRKVKKRMRGPKAKH